MRRARSKVAVLIFIVSLLSCVSSSKKSYEGDPVESADKLAQDIEEGDSDQHFLLRIKRSEAAMALLGEAQTQLRSGNSQGAIISLTKAKEYNPWHDDIKDTYVLATRAYVTATQKMIASNAGCSLILRRLNFINSVAQDEMDKFNDASLKCNFKSSSQPIVSFDRNVDLPSSQKQIELQVAKDLEGELDYIIQRNKYVPAQELLILGIQYLQNTTFRVKDIKVDPNTSDSDNIILSVKIEERFTGPDKFEYCDQIRKLVEVEGTGHHLRCRGLPENEGFRRSGFFSYSNGAYISIPSSWVEPLEKYFPIPRISVFRFTVSYKDGTKEDYFQTVTLDKAKQKRFPEEAEECRPRTFFGVADSCIYIKRNAISREKLVKLKSISLSLDPEKTFEANSY